MLPSACLTPYLGKWFHTFSARRRRYDDAVADLWTCPSCERRFANVNQWHSCIEMALEDHLATKTEVAVELYRAIENSLRTCGEFRIHPQKGRVAFIARMTFAGVKLARRWADVGFILPSPIDDPRIRELVLYGPTSFGHEIRIAQTEDVDGDVLTWLCAAHRRGLRETLDSTAHVDPLVGRSLELLLVPLRTRVVEHESGLALSLPRYAGEAFAAHPHITARIGARHYRGEVEHAGDGYELATTELEESGLGIGDATDAFLRAEL